MRTGLVQVTTEAVEIRKAHGFVPKSVAIKFLDNVVFHIHHLERLVDEGSDFNDVGMANIADVV